MFNRPTGFESKPHGLRSSPSRQATQTSLIYGLSGAIDMLVFYPAGKLMDRKGRPWVAVPSTVIMGMALILIPFTGGFVPLLLAALLIGFGHGISSGLVITLCRLLPG
ncbi:MFS family permease [Arthrobacter sp. 2762]